MRETLAEILVADLGDTVSQSPYLIVRNSAISSLPLNTGSLTNNK